MYMSLSESINFIVTVIHYINRMVSLADVSYLMDKADRLSPAAEKKTLKWSKLCEANALHEKANSKQVDVDKMEIETLGMKLKG